MRVERCRGLQIFEGMDLGTLQPMLERLREVRLEEGEVLLVRGRRNTSLYVLLSGKLGIHLQSVSDPPLTHIEKGECVGELSVIGDDRTTAFVVAASDCELLEIPRDRLWEMVAAAPLVARNLLLILSLRMRLTNRAITDAEKRRELFERCARRDALTGLYNRRHLDDVLQEHACAVAGGAAPFSLAMLDVDHFKRYNDTNGHTCGDCALRTVAGALSDNVREGDVAARYGGEEFAVVMPATGLEEAVGVAERLRLGVAETSVSGEDGRELPGVTVSVGVCRSRPGEDVCETVARADGALYGAKRSGRNRVCVEDGGA